MVAGEKLLRRDAGLVDGAHAAVTRGYRWSWNSNCYKIGQHMGCHVPCQFKVALGLLLGVNSIRISCGAGLKEVPPAQIEARRCHQVSKWDAMSHATSLRHSIRRYMSIQFDFLAKQG